MLEAQVLSCVLGIPGVRATAWQCGALLTLRSLYRSLLQQRGKTDIMQGLSNYQYYGARASYASNDTQKYSCESLGTYVTIKECTFEVSVGDPMILKSSCSCLAFSSKPTCHICKPDLTSKSLAALPETKQPDQT